MQGSLDLQCADRLAITGGRDRRGAGGVAVFRRFFQRDGTDRRARCKGDGICNEAAVGISADLDGIGVRLAAFFSVADTVCSPTMAYRCAGISA